jgi:DNA helicase-2/ATP-dependent DNA helicase PcrA
MKAPTDEQKRIIDCITNIVVTAGPGSGKTYTIVEKIAKIIPGLPDYRGVIAISFTNKASDELKNRCKQRCSDTKKSFFGTIDKFYISQIIIPFSCHVTGMQPEYKIIDDIDKESKYASLLNNEGEMNSSKYELIISGLREGMIFLKYTGETALYLLKNVPETIQYIKAKFSYIIIDEYQDCGSIQNEIFLKLIESGLHGIAVGDIHQAIYGFNGRFPKYLIALIGRKDFTHFELNKNHRCHPSISEYSLCLFNASKQIPTDKRVYLVSITGDEGQIAAKIDQYIDAIKRKYDVVNNNQVAILCRSNNTVSRMNMSLNTKHKVFRETVLDRDNSQWGRLFCDLLTSYFDKSVFSVDYAEKIFSKEDDPKKYRSALYLCQSIFSSTKDTFKNNENKMINLAELIYPHKGTDLTKHNLHQVICDSSMLASYAPACDDELNLMTLHKSKGLEFNIVFHMDMYKWVIPNEHGNDDDKQQDLNLHFVGITRAKDVCYIMNGTIRHNKKNVRLSCEPSPFLQMTGLKERRRDVEWK